MTFTNYGNEKNNMADNLETLATTSFFFCGIRHFDLHKQIAEVK